MAVLNRMVCTRGIRLGSDFYWSAAMNSRQGEIAEVDDSGVAGGIVTVLFQDGDACLASLVERHEYTPLAADGSDC